MKKIFTPLLLVPLLTMSIAMGASAKGPNMTAWPDRDFSQSPLTATEIEQHVRNEAGDRFVSMKTENGKYVVTLKNNRGEMKTNVIDPQNPPQAGTFRNQLQGQNQGQVQQGQGQNQGKAQGMMKQGKNKGQMQGQGRNQGKSKMQGQGKAQGKNKGQNQGQCLQNQNGCPNQGQGKMRNQ